MSHRFAQKIRPSWIWLLRLGSGLNLFLAYPVLGAAAQSQFDLWSTEQGLPQNSVQAILQTHDGYLWLATSDGLVRFDGVRFSVFNKANTKGMRSNRLTRLYESSDGSLWIGTEDNGIIRYYAHQFTTYTEQDGLKRNWVWDIREDKEGQLLVLSQYGVVTWREGRFIPYRPEEGLSEKIYGWHQRSGGLSFFDDRGLHVFDGRVFHSYDAADGLPVRDVVNVIEDQRSVVWAETRNAHLFRLQDGVFTRYALKDLTDISALYQDHQGTIWIGTLRHGLGCLQDGIFTTCADVKGSVLSIYEDREGTLWIGATDGLRRLRRQVVSVHSGKDGLSSPNVYSIHEGHDSAIWLGTWHGGLSRFKDGKFTNYSRKDGLISQLVTAVYEDRAGNLWIGTNDERLSLFKDGRFTVYGDSEYFTDRRIASLYQDRTGTLWVGTGLELIGIRDGILTRYTTQDGLISGTVQAIYEDHLGQLWIGTNNGLSCFINGAFTNYTEREGLSGENVRAIYEDSAGTLWIGTYDGGLNRFKDGRFTRYTTSEGLFNNGVFQILEDERGYFWIGCNLGLYRVKRQELEDFAAGTIRSIIASAYGKKDGMLNAECNGGSQPSGIRTRDGRLWFPTQNGVAVIDPATIKFNELPPLIVIESCRVDNRPVNVDVPVEVGPEQSNFEIEYTGLSFINSEQVRFKYKLEGLDSDWIDAGTHRVVTYKSIPSGAYTFRVIAANSDGVWNTEGATLRIIVLPPFWRRWWFVTFVFSAAVLGVVAVYRNRISRLHRAREVQEVFSQQLIESQEHERQRIAAELHDSLGQNLLIIRNRALIGAFGAEANIHAKTHFDEISDAAARAIEEVREIAYNLRPHHLDQLGLTTTIRVMIEKLSAASTIRFTTKLEQVDGLFTPDAEITLYRILQEAVSNIVRHSRATEASVEVRRSERLLLLTVRDNGRGWNAKAMKLASGRIGFGLLGIAERVRILGGTHVIHSAAGQGTTLTISLDLPANGKEQGR